MVSTASALGSGGLIKNGDVSSTAQTIAAIIGGGFEVPSGTASVRIVNIGSSTIWIQLGANPVTTSTDEEGEPIYAGGSYNLLEAQIAGAKLACASGESSRIACTFLNTVT